MPTDKPIGIGKLFYNISSFIDPEKGQMERHLNKADVHSFSCKHVKQRCICL